MAQVGGLSLILRDIKIEHSLFAMPFAVMGAFMAAGGMPAGRPLALLLVAVVFARSAAMAFNRLVDAQFDKTNPRTESRPLAAGRAKKAEYAVFIGFNAIGFILTAYFINPLAFKLSPLALVIVFFYSLTKRFTPYSHFFLGIALSLSPIGAWVAVKGEVAAPSLALGAAVIFWLMGLDIIYSCQDVEHDKRMGLNSIPSRFGIRGALWISSLSHLIMVAALTGVYFMGVGLGGIYLTGVALVGALLLYEHSIVKADDLDRVNVAFFNINGMVSVGLMVFVITDLLV